jgi:alpha/beta superfamily hydrolase
MHMAEKQIFFQSGPFRLEGLLDLMPGTQGVVVTHPHPLYGGNMYHPVVEAVLKAYRHQGYSTLRFNFRGVDQSEGQYDNGIGEQEDVKNALGFLTEQGKTRLELGGYSFGAWVCAFALRTMRQVERLVMVSPPVAFMPFDSLGRDRRIALIIGADGDDIAPPPLIREQMPLWNPEVVFKVIAGSDHFYGGKAPEITDLVENFLIQPPH